MCLECSELLKMYANVRGRFLKEILVVCVENSWCFLFYLNDNCSF